MRCTPRALMDVPLTGVYLISVRLISVYLMGMHLTGLSRGCESYRCVILLGTYLIDMYLVGRASHTGMRLIDVHLKGVYLIQA
jgi:hypothetical protein